MPTSPRLGLRPHTALHLSTPSLVSWRMNRDRTFPSNWKGWLPREGNFEAIFSFRNTWKQQFTNVYVYTVWSSIFIEMCLTPSCRKYQGIFLTQIWSKSLIEFSYKVKIYFHEFLGQNGIGSQNISNHHLFVIDRPTGIVHMFVPNLVEIDQVAFSFQPCI